MGKPPSTGLPIAPTANMAMELSADALEYFRLGEDTLAMYCLDAMHFHCIDAEVSALDYSRVLLDLAYEMACHNLGINAINAILDRASRWALADRLEVLLTKSRIHLLWGNPFEAGRLLDEIRSTPSDSIGLGMKGQVFVSCLLSCGDAIDKAVNEIYRTRVVCP